MHFLLAAASDPSNLTNLAQYGVLGLVVLGFIFGKIVPGYILDRREAEITRLNDKIDAQHNIFNDKVFPAMQRSTEVLESAIKLIDQLDEKQQEAAKRRRAAT